MTRTSRGSELNFDTEIEKTARRLRKITKQQKACSSAQTEIIVDLSEFFKEPEIMAEPEPTLRRMANPDVNQQPLCIELPNEEVNFELKSGLIHLLPTFRGLAGEDPHKHLKEFHVVCSSMKPQGAIVDQIKMQAFHFSLTEKAKDWLYYLPPGSITTWNELKRRFLEKLFLASRATSIRKEIYGIREQTGETFYEYWERFNQLCASCPHH